jgi:tetratricopeptide (TPR) repeat protein
MKNRKPEQHCLSLFLIMGLLFLLLVLPLSSQDRGKKTADRIKGKIETFIGQKQFSDAESYCQGLRSKKKKICYLCLANASLELGRYEKVLEYCETLLSGKKEEDRHIYLLMGRAYLGLGKHKSAVDYFKEGEPSAYRAQAYGKLADEYFNNSDLDSAKKFYTEAVNEYEFVLKHFYYKWKNEFSRDLKRCVQQLDQFEKSDIEKANQALSEKILAGTARYCERMKSSAFYFFCSEEIAETMDLSGPYGQIQEWRPLETSRVSHAVKNVYLYEYQLIQEGEKIQETRTLLEQNGNKKNEPNAKLKFSGCRFEKLIFGPNAILSEFAQRQYYYKILKEDKLWGEQVFIIEAIPLSYSRTRQLFGKIWISKKDFSVMKIEWIPKSIGYSHFFEKRALNLKSTPEITFFEEFKTERSGIRFPSRYFLEEAYVDKDKRKFVRQKLDAHFKDYKFFVVASEVIEAKPGDVKLK